MGSAPSFSARAESRYGVTTIALCGELDMATVPLLEQHLAEFDGDEVETIALDLRDLTFIDSSTIHAFVAARGRAEVNGYQLILVNASEPAQREFELSGIQHLLAWETTAGRLMPLDEGLMLPPLGTEAIEVDALPIWSQGDLPRIQPPLQDLAR